MQSHNAYLAEREYGKEVMDQFRRPGGRVSEPAPAYGLQWYTPSGVAMNDSA